MTSTPSVSVTAQMALTVRVFVLVVSWLRVWSRGVCAVLGKARCLVEVAGTGHARREPPPSSASPPGP